MAQDTAEVPKEDRTSVKTILVVEDDTANSAFLALAISQETRYHALLATDSLRALEVVRHIKPHLFVLDYRLPHLNGISLYEQLHAISGLEDVPAIILSAGFEECRDEIEAHKLVGLRKPFALDEFLLAIEAALGKTLDPLPQ